MNAKLGMFYLGWAAGILFILITNAYKAGGCG